VNLYPAIDILGGNAVRLVKGDFDAKKVYDQDPLSAARAFADAGARFLHVVDLDGAKSGEPVNLEHLRLIAGELGLPVQYGGGLRTMQDVAAAFAAGATRVILGTAIFTNTELPGQAMEAHGRDNVLVSIDARGGYVATHGWLETTQVPAREAIERFSEGDSGVKRFVFTNIDHDGMLDGVNDEEVEMVARAAGDGSVILSGGIGELAHLQAIARLRAEQQLDGIDGVIVGKALYERRFTVGQALAALAPLGGA
jgi:phosphoribosylformimino-5-aminoimidazole carboxamide ribotide isomerase